MQSIFFLLNPSNTCCMHFPPVANDEIYCEAYLFTRQMLHPKSLPFLSAENTKNQRIFVARQDLITVTVREKKKEKHLSQPISKIFLCTLSGEFPEQLTAISF